MKPAGKVPAGSFTAQKPGVLRVFMEL